MTRERQAHLLDEAEDIILTAEKNMARGNDPVASICIALVGFAKIVVREAKKDLQD